MMSPLSAFMKLFKPTPIIDSLTIESEDPRTGLQVFRYRSETFLAREDPSTLFLGRSDKRTSRNYVVISNTDGTYRRVGVFGGVTPRDAIARAIKSLTRAGHHFGRR